MRKIKIYKLGALIVLFLLLFNIYSAEYYEINIYNTQYSPTPVPFQQDIAICNGTVSLRSNFSYINNATLFNKINPNGQNVFFFRNLLNPTGSILYSWYNGQININGVFCDVWWVKLPDGISANSTLTIYMYVGNTSDNFYVLYYPYVGAPIQVLGTSQYDNGNNVFNYYQNFGNLSSLPSGWNNLGSVSVTYNINYTRYVQTSAYYWYYGLYRSLPSSIAGSSFLIGTYVYSYPNGNTNYFGITNQTPVISNRNYYTVYTSLPQGYNFVLLNVNSSSSSSTIAYLTRVPGWITGSYQDIYWVFISAYPPNGVMPSISIVPVMENLTIILNQSSANVNPGQTISINVSANNTLGNNMTLQCLPPSGVTCSPTQVNITSGGSYIFTITAPSNVNSYQQYNITFLA
ncbi:MAG: hypothetical protein ACP5G1_00855, partial [Nanopusillaceae archaeon]